MWQQSRNGNDAYKTEHALCLHGRHLDGQQQQIESGGKKRQQFARRAKKSEGVPAATARTAAAAGRPCVGTAEKSLLSEPGAVGAKQMCGLSNVSSAAAAAETPTSYCCACSTCSSKISVEKKR